MNVQRQIDRLVAYQAAEWYEQLKDDTGTNGGNASFVQWISESPRHMEAFLAVAGEARLIRSALVQGTASGLFDLQKLLRNAKPGVVDFAELRPTATRDSKASTRPARKIALWAAAAAVAIVAIGAALYSSTFSWERFETRVGEQRTLQLSEGSVVNLNTVSRVDVRFEKSERDVHLISGEATFKVTPDPKRPFRVHAPGVVVEAIGTEFNVYTKPNGTTRIAVIEGKVKVYPLSADASSKEAVALPLAAGEALRIGASGQLERESQPVVSEAIAWQQRKLIFKRASLEDIAAEFNRYNKSARIRLEGIEPGSLRFSGAFNADDPQSLAALLMHEPDLEVERRGEEILIRGRR